MADSGKNVFRKFSKFDAFLQQSMAYVHENVQKRSTLDKKKIEEQLSLHGVEVTNSFIIFAIVCLKLIEHQN